MGDTSGMAANLVIKLLIQSGVIPVIVGLLVGAVAGAGLRLRKRGISNTGLIAALILPAAYLAGDVAMRGWPKTPPTEASQWMPWIAVAGLVVAMLSLALTRHRWLLWLMGAVGLTAEAGLVLKPLLQHAWQDVHGLFKLGLVSLLLIGCFLLQVWVCGRTSRLAAHALLLVQCLATSILLAATGSLLLGQLAGGLAAGAFANLLLAWKVPQSFVSLPAALILTALLGGLLLNGHFFSDTPAWAAVAMLIAPVLALVALLPPMNRWQTAAQGWISIGGVALFLAILLGYTVISTSAPVPYRP